MIYNDEGTLTMDTLDDITTKEAISMATTQSEYAWADETDEISKLYIEIFEDVNNQEPYIIREV